MSQEDGRMAHCESVGLIPMDERTIRKLEHELEEAIAGVVACLGVRRLPLLPSQQTMHLMAKVSRCSIAAPFTSLALRIPQLATDHQAMSPDDLRAGHADSPVPVPAARSRCVPGSTASNAAPAWGYPWDRARSG